MDLKHEIKNIMIANSDRLFNAAGDYVQCINESDWNGVIDEIIGLITPNSATQSVDRYVLLKAEGGNAFWTIHEGINYEKEGFIVLFQCNDRDEMIEEWRNYYRSKISL